MDPLRRVGLLRRLLKRPRERPGVSGGEAIEEALVYRKVQHELQPVAFRAEVLHALVRRHVRLGEHDGIATSPLQELPELVEESEVTPRWDGCTFLRDDERHRVHAEARDPELQPIPHDLRDLVPHGWTVGIEVWLEVIEAVNRP